MSPKTVDYTFVRDLTMLIQKADSSVITEPRGSLCNSLVFDLQDYQEYDRGFVAFACSSKGGKITRKSVSQMCDKKNSVLFTKTECLILSPDFKLPDESQVLLKVPRKNNMYSFDLKNVVPSKGLTCLFAKAISDESNLWHRRLGHIDFKTMNKLVKGNLVRGSGPEWPFDIESLTNSMNYQSVSAGNRTNGNAGSEINSDAGQAKKEKVPDQEYILLPLLNTCSNVPSSYEEAESLPKNDTGKKSTAQPTCVDGGKTGDLGSLDQQMKNIDDSENTNSFNTASPTVNIASNKDGTFQRTNAEWDFSTPITVNAVGSSFSHPNALYNYSKTGTELLANLCANLGKQCLQGVLNGRRKMEPKKVTQALDDESWVEAMHEELLQFKLLNKSLSTEFEQLMHKRFKMSSIGEFTFFLGLHVDQRKDGIFLSQDKYVCDILKKFGFSSVKSANTLMETHKPLSKDANGTDVDVHLYRSMIGSLMYLTSLRPDIMFAVCACSRFQVQPKVSHMHAVKRIFRYLKGQPTLGLWYPKESPLELIAYSDSDYACASLVKKSTIGGCQFLGSRLIS
nr:hypothetical protein [Tanacetum cinerariifolium]